ncbi:thiamine phosphate synthase [Pseudochryseolinea flava]|uniref:Thiamine-phosphate synthase n=1 Tax=Pseudochryseolinea flava TaxID=2059302 RepID=A0A364XZH1_9BACT|nr:thiamine phosphate synthase [Pseudochryseolinea flava]RAV99012.1 thiamine phosphate synthase [Pseudochryseolinea flava]
MLNRLQYISQGVSSHEQIDNIRHALDAGCQWIQLRFKNTSEEVLQTTAAQVKRHCEQYAATFILNDDPKLAMEVDADGVHLGLTDMPIEQARNIIGSHKIIGGTANTLQDVFKRAHEKCDYVGVGPYRFTSTKEKLSPILGLSGYQAIMHSMQVHDIQMPVYAIGGILADDLEELMRCGVYGIAVSGMITKHQNKLELIQLLNQRLYATT